MADPGEPGGSDPTTESGGEEKDRSGGTKTPSRGRIPSLTPLKSVAAPSETVAPAPGLPSFRPNVTAYWTPPMPVAGQGQSGFIRIATPVSERPDGVVSVISTGQRRPAQKDGASTTLSSHAPSSVVVSSDEAPSKRRTNTPIVTRDGLSPSPARPETPPFGSPSQPAPISTIATSGVPSRAPDARSVRIPFRVAEYEVATRIAQGGTGSIYVCRRSNSTPPHSLLTLKVIRQHAQQKEAVAASFKREARVGTVFRHPNALTVLDSGIYENQPFLIFPYHEGASLALLMAEGQRPPPAVVVTVLLDALRALQHAQHAADEQGNPLGLVHGDVSPDNILVGTDGVSRLTDFGSAHFTAQAGQNADLGMAKPAYMSPEQLRGEALDVRSDIFALGIVMWTALTGQKLFAADTYDQTIMRVMRRKIPAPSTLGGPAALDDVCLQALSRAPEGRFATANAMADALMGVAVKADLVATRERVGHWVRRDMGESLNERRRRIEHMFGDGHTPGPSPTGASPASARPKPSHAAPPSATIQMNRVTEALGAKKAAAFERTLFIPGRGPQPQPPAPKMSRRQWYIVTCVSVAAFFLTLAVGNWISRASAHRSTAARSADTSPAVSPTPARVADLPSGSVP